jgi:hypothetical protein
VKVFKLIFLKRLDISDWQWIRITERDNSFLICDVNGARTYFRRAAHLEAATVDILDRNGYDSSGGFETDQLIHEMENPPEWLEERKERKSMKVMNSPEIQIRR